MTYFIAGWYRQLWESSEQEFVREQQTGRVLLFPSEEKARSAAALAHCPYDPLDQPEVFVEECIIF